MNKITSEDFEKQLSLLKQEVHLQKKELVSLRKEEQRYKDIFENANDLIHSVDSEGRLLYANRLWRETLGYTEDEIKKMKIFDIVDVDYQSKCISIFNCMMREEQVEPTETIFVAKDGQKIMVEGRCNPKYEDGKIAELIGIFRDITDRKRAEEFINQREERFQLVIEGADLGLWDWDLQTNKIYFNNNYFTMLGYDRDDFPHCLKTWKNLLHPEDKDRTIGLLKNCIDHGKAWSLEFRLRTKNDDYKWILGRGRTVSRDHAGIPLRASGTHQDITERKLTEEKVRESEELFKQLSEASFEGVVFHENGVVISANKQYLEMFGYNESEIIGKQALPLTITPESMGIISSKIKSGSIDPYEVVGLRKNGEKFPMLIMGRNIKQKNSQVRIAVLRDITQHKQAEEKLKKIQDELECRVQKRTLELQKTHTQLLHAEKLAAIGKLSASIAHEFNNPLTGIQSVIEGIKINIALDEEYQELTDLALAECGRVKSLIENLQDFNKPSSGVKETVDIHTVLDDMILMVKKEFNSSHITIKKQYTPELPMVQIVTDQIKQVLLNLLSNAKDAIADDSGSVTIATEKLNDKLVARINNTGNCIPQDILPHIFEPFFTTKSAVKGTGLGLSVSYGIIKGHRGDIMVDSAPDRGTTFSVILPLSEKRNEQTEYTDS